MIHIFFLLLICLSFAFAMPNEKQPTESKQYHYRMKKIKFHTLEERLAEDRVNQEKNKRESNRIKELLLMPPAFKKIP